MSEIKVLKCFDDGNFGLSYVSDVDFEKLSSEEVKNFMQLLSIYLIKDINKTTQLNILNVLQNLVKHHCADVLNYLKLTFVSLGKTLIQAHSHINGVCGFGVSSLFGIRILIDILCKIPVDKKSDDIKNLLQFIILLPSGCYMSGRKNIIKKCKEMLKQFIHRSPHFIEQICNIIDSTESRPHFLTFVSIVSEFKQNILNEETYVNYLKLCFNDKYQIPTEVIIRICSLLQRAVPNRTAFEEHLLTTMTKMTLRSPEKALFVIDCILKQLAHLDLSLSNGELTKALLTQLQSKNEILRLSAKKCLIGVVSLTSARDSVETIVTLIMSLLTGNEKVAHLDTRLTIYSTLTDIPAAISLGSATATMTLARNVLTPLTNIKETQESILLAMIECVTHWAHLDKESVPPCLVTWLKNNAFNQKNSVSVKFAMYNCMNECYDRTQKLVSLNIGPLQETLERLTKTSLLVAGVHEVMPVVELLLRYCAETDSGMTDSSPLVGLVMTVCGLRTSVSAGRMFSDQSLQVASARTLASLASVIRSLLVHHYNTLAVLPDHLAMVIRCLVLCCVHDDYESVRRRSLECLSVVTRCHHGPAIVDLVLDYVQSMDLISGQQLLSRWFWPVSGDVTTQDQTGDQDRLGALVHRLEQFLSVLLDLGGTSGRQSGPERYSVQWTVEARTRLMYRALVPLNQHVLTSFHGNLWAKHAQRLIGNTDSIVALAKDDIIAGLTSTAGSLDQNKASLLHCLCDNFSEQLINDLLQAVIAVLDSPVLVACTETEVGIMNTRPGYLFNKTLLHSLPKYESNKSNIKRENKLYSYKDQMAGIEIKRELEDKKKKSSQESKKAESDNPIEMLAGQLTKNHMEQISNELAKEKGIRYKMEELQQRVTLMSDIVRHISQWRKECFFKYFDQIIKVLQKLIISSPIGRMQASLLFNDLHLLTNLSRKQSIWILRVLFFDSAQFNDDMRENWKYSVSGQEFIDRLDILGNEDLGEYSTEYVDIMQRKHSEFSTFLYVLPALCRLCQSIADMENNNSEEKIEQWWMYLTWMDISMLTKILNIVKNQICHGEVNKRQLFNSDLLHVMVKVTQNTEIHDIHNSVNKIVLTMMEMFNGDTSDLVLANTNVFETVLNCFVCNTVEARILALNCIDTVVGIDQINGRRLSMYLWIARYDMNESVATNAAELCDKFSMTADEHNAIELIDFVTCPHDQIVQGAIAALTELIRRFPEQLCDLLSHVYSLYRDLAYVAPPICDAFHRVLVPSPADRWHARLGLAKALISLSKYVSDTGHLLEIFNFFIPDALNDRNSDVRCRMLEAGQNVIEHSGKNNVSLLLPILENYLNTAENIASNDIVRQSVVIMMGSLAKHLDASDDRFNSIFGKLIEALNFPSADVQRAVSDTFDPLVKAFDEDRQRAISNSLLSVLFNSKEVAERTGAAFGIAGIIKAVGITKLKTFKINDALIEGIQNKNNEIHREIALFTYEQISAKMSRMFEPYVPQLVKYLLDTFADPCPKVRETACRTARMLMSNLSAPGVKIVLNPLLSGLDTNQWRTKSVSVELLGSMAYCAPKQLSNCLPTIVPKILSILSDSHPNVIKAGRQALREIGSVIQNKEIEVIVPVLIDALCDPIKKTDEGLDCLIGTKFVHQVDAASLAIIMSMVSRAFKERRSETKRKAAQIIGNLHSLIEDKDLEPYCASLLPGLKGCMVDPDPGVREVASIALGTIAKVMEPQAYEELMIWLMEALKDEASGVNRSGAAQGLSEVLLQKGLVHLDKFMPDILENTQNTKLLSHVRDGYLMLYIYLPKRFQDQFAPYVKVILPSILQALSDEVEFIRETAFNAGQGIISIYSHIAIDTMLPNFESGMLDSNWRIRYSSIKLLGELLFKLTGISGKGTTVGGNDDESFAQSTSQTVIEASLGPEKYRQVLAEIFLARMDVALQVRQAAIHIWKLMVVNTARSLRLIMTELMALVLNCLSGDDNDNRIMATKSLGDVVKKLGERSLPDIFHDLETGFEHSQANHRIGVCNAILEILKACPREQITNYLDKVMPIFKSCLCDDNEDVRKIAGEIFELLHSALGVRIVDIVIPDLVDKLDDATESDNALKGLCTLVFLKGRFVIPSLIPRLTYPTVNTKAFSELAKVAGDILSRHIVTVLPALLQAVSNVVGSDSEQVEVDNCCQVIMAMDDAQTTQIILKELTTSIGGGSGSGSVKDQIAGLKIMTGYMSSCADNDLIQSNRVLMNYVSIIIRSVVRLFAAEDRAVLLAAFDCLTGIIESLGSTNVDYVKDIRDSILVVIRDQSSRTGQSSDEVLIPALCLEDRGINALVELYREALVNGRSDLKEVAASGLEDCISSTETKVLGKAAIKIAGPLIRTMSERHNAATKSAIVSSLGKLILKCPTQVKLFATQMQTIFIKCLSDPNQQLRHKSGMAQSRLAQIITKPDVFFNEMLAREFQADNEYKATGLEAIRLCLESAGHRVSQECLGAMVAVLRETLGDRDDQIRVAGSSCLGVAVSCLADCDSALTTILDQSAARPGPLPMHGTMVCVMVLCKRVPGRLYPGSRCLDRVVALITEQCATDKVFVATTGYRALGFLLRYLLSLATTTTTTDQGSGSGSEPLMTTMLTVLQNGMKHQCLDVKDVVVDVCGYLAWTDAGAAKVALYARAALAILINGYRAKENSLRIKSERCIMDLVRLSASHRRPLAGTTGDNAVVVVDESVYKVCYECLEPGTRAALAEVVNRFKRTYITGTAKETSSHCPDLDNTYLAILSVHE